MVQVQAEIRQEAEEEAAGTARAAAQICFSTSASAAQETRTEAGETHAGSNRAARKGPGGDGACPPQAPVLEPCRLQFSQEKRQAAAVEETAGAFQESRYWGESSPGACA